MRSPKPTAFGSFGYGWQQLWKFFLHLFLVGVIVWITNAPAQGFGAIGGQNAFDTPFFVALNMLAVVYGILVAPVINYGGEWLYLRYMRDEQPNIATVFEGFRRNYLNIVLANLLVLVICGLGFLLFIVPGMIFAVRLAFVPYLVMDKNLDPVAAIEKSWFMTRGHGWRIFGMYVLSILMFFAGLLLLVVGSLFALMWIGCAFASLYHAIDLADQAQLDQNGGS